MKKLVSKFVIVVAFIGLVASSSKPANAGIPVGHGSCVNGWATYYELVWNGGDIMVVPVYISGCTN